MNNKKNDISIKRSQLSPAKQALLEKRLRGEYKSDNQEKFIPCRSQHNPVPLSFAQQRLWFLAQLEPDNPFYNVSAIASLKGKLNFKALQDSFQEIINRHEALRCNFKTIEDKPVAFIYPTKSLLLPVLDISELPINQQAAEVQKLASQEAQDPFDISRDLLLRVKLLRLNPEEHILLFTMHHIVSDGWSIGVLIHELATLYQAFCDDKTSLRDASHSLLPQRGTSLPELPIQYGDFAIWQQEYLQGAALTAQKNYWKRQLGGALPVLQLPTDYPRPAVQSYKGNNYCFTIPKYLTTALKILSQQAGATLFMSLLTAFKILLYRYSQENDIIVGTAIANRNLPQIEKLIGFFVNTLVLRTDVSGNPSFLDLLARVKEVTLDAYTHQDLPFEKLVEEIQPERNLSHNPLFQVWFALNNSPMPALQIGELTLTISEAERATAQFDLSLDMVEREEELIGTFEYSSDLFDADTITRITEHFQNLLAGIVANPEQHIASLPLLTKAAENDLLWKWNNNKFEYPQKQCIHQLFETCVNKTPNAVAIVFQQQRLTYQELNNKANQIAHYLHSLGVNQNLLVGICVDRSVEMIVALLGVLKAGGAYVPLDPAYPEERLSFMLSDSQVSVLLTQQRLVSSLAIENVPVVCLDRDWEIISQQSQVNPATHSSPDDLAYVIYTSGSTGKSKGVAIAHRSLVNKFYAWDKAYQLDCLTSHLQMANFAFDVFSGDVIRALCSGAKLVLCPREWLLEAENLYQLMLAEEVDSAEFVPVVLKNLVQYLERTQQNLHFMSLLVVGSDTLYVKEYQEFQRFCGKQTRLINSYGVTEATIDSTYFEVTEINLSENGLVPIGRPFANTEIYILDPYLQPVPVGIPGELYIGGEGLAQGYLNRPDLTKEKFILWNGEKRLYKTGDKAKYLADGNIEFLGRLDYQIKLRGYRIELGEIEAVIKQHPYVGEAVVIAREDVPGDQRLVAYFIANFQVDQINQQQLSAPLNADLPAPLTKNQQSQLALDLREVLEQKLPEYMIPAAFVVLEALPINPNGKLDRQALPAPEATQLLSESGFIAPSTAIEEMLVNIWTEVLGIENIGIHHNFFNLGGHSLLATRLVSQIRQAFQIELPLRRIFEKPTIAGLAKDIEKATKANLGVEATKIERIERSPHLPLSFAQQRFWFLAQLEMHSSSYNMPSAVRLQGQLNIEALQQSFNDILRRHEALRTNFQTIEGQPVAVILPPTSVQLPILDISNLPVNQQELEVQQQAIEEAQQPFDLNDGFLLRVKLLRLSEQEHVLLLTMHHIASDAWSTDILVREFATLYQAFREEQPAPLAELPIQYVDFAAWQRQWLQGERLESQVSYWRKQLEGVPKLLELPTDFPRPPVQSFRGATYTFELSQQLSVALNHLSQQQGTTLFMTLLAAFQTLLYRYTGSEDIAIGSPIGSRNRAELEGLIGLFINTLVLRTNLAGNPTFEQLLNQVRSVALSAYAYQDLPFELLVEELQPQRNLSYTPLFQVMFVLQNAPMSALELPNLTLSLLEGNGITAKFDLTLDMTETQSGLIGTFEYNSDLFQESTIKRMAGHLQTLLEAIVTNPQQRLSQLPLLTAPEEYQLLQKWNDTEVAYPVNKCIHELFEQQVELTPDAVAVVYENQQLTYRELNQRVNQLAHYLQKLGVQPEVLVGICVERSLEMVIGLLAILKAGGAYVPLDPNYPQQRLEYILQDTQAPVLLTQASLVEVLPQHQGQVVCLDSDWHLIAQQSQNNLYSELTTENLAYIIYTSGSTGKPKGVQIPHLALSNFLYSMNETPGLTSEDKLLAVTTYSFDIAALEIFLPIIVGACLIVASQEIISDGNQLLAKIKDSKATVMQATPATWQLLLVAGWDGDSQLKIICGGEALSAPLASKLLERCSSVWNMYGPTETTIWSAASRIETVNDTVPISCPIANTQLYILDQYNQLVPVGIAGELCIGGVGLARGYFQRPDLTAEKFIPNPFNDEPSARLYKTGDLARYLPNGEIEYIGRIDHQVKIRGFRIELGEIDAVINQHPSISASVVIVREDGTENKSLVAYITVQPQQTIAIPELRRFLESKLPNYMVPTAIVVLKVLPLTPNGKIDRRALPAPDLTQLISESNFVAPSTPVEEMLAGIWAQVLGLEKIGVNDNFFDLGGHSLIATRVMSQIRQVFEVEIPLRRLFELPTVSELAKEIQTAINADKRLEVPPIKPIARSQQLPLSFAQQRLWFLSELEPNSPFYNIPAAVRLEGQLNLAALEQSFNEILRRHEVLRTNFRTVAGQAIAVISPATPQLLSVIDLSELPPAQQETQVRQLALAEAQQPFNLEADTLLRVKLLRLSEQEYVTLLTMHHIVSDGWSIDVLVRELATLYQAFSQRQPSPLLEIEIQYADFAAWQRQWLEKEVLESQLAYWRKQLDGAPAVLELPTDYPRPAIQSSRGATYSFCLSKDQSLALKSLSRQQGSTLFMTLLAAFKTLLHRYTGSNDIVIGSPIANRNYNQIEGLIGFFVNTLVLRTNLGGNPSFSEVLHRVKEVALGAYTHQDTPFELLIEKMQPQRDLSHTPLFQVMFVLQNAQNSEIELTGLTLSTLETDSGTAKFDLTLDMRETEEGLVGTLEYSIDLFEPQTIQSMAGHLQTLLGSIIANPEQRLSELSLLTAAEQSQLLADWNQTQVEYSSDQCIHQLFEAQVERTPDAVAVVFENEQLTYRQLNQRANQLAHYLQKLGVGAEVLVEICVERSLEVVIGLLAILKAGSAYIPLDPAYPSERLAFILEDAQAPVLVTQANLVQEIPQHNGKVVYLDADWSLIAQQSQENLCCSVTTENLAYVIYTSGSTGKPKGVQIPHGALSNFLQAMRKTPGLTEQDTLLAVTTISFDIAALELFLPIIVGGRLVIASREIASDAMQLSAKISDSKATVIQATPATWQLLMAANWQGNHSLKILCGGEALPRQLANQLVDKCGSVWNMYGPTETTIWSSACLVKTDSNTVPISHPIANTQFYILDQHTQLVPVGVPGELHIGGAGLARGYLNRPELTAQKFIPNPFSDKWGARLYKTSDLARYLPSGEIEYIGRIDHQVKLRGFRIELGEIEAVINQHPSVTKTVAIDREDIPGQKRLVAYLVLERSQTLAANQLRSFLKQHLPDYMIPSAFVELETLPLTPNGKVDRRALPVPESAVITTAETYVAPRTPIEEVLAGIWTEVLGVNGFGIDDNFFDLGGHSLLATQLISRLRDTFRIEIPLSYLFESPTIAECAQRIETKIRTGEKLEAPPIKPVNRSENLALSFAQQRLWLLDQLDPGNNTYNDPISVRLSGSLNITALEQSLNAIVSRHEILRTVFVTVEGQPVQKIQPITEISIPIVDLRVNERSPQQREAEAQRIALEEAQHLFNLAQGPLIRATLLQLDETEYVFLLTMHHIISDLWSMTILIQELADFYAAFSQNKSLTLPDLPIQYADFAVWQREWMQGKVLETQLNYWKQQLKDAPTKLELPTDKPRPLQPTYTGTTQSFHLPKDLSDALRLLSKREDVTLSMTLLTTFNVLLHYYTKQEDIVVGSPIANRNRSEIEGLIGFFVNSLALRTDLSRNPSFSELLRRTREVNLGAYAHQDLPFEKLVAELQIKRDLNYNPLFQVWFAFQNIATPDIQKLTLYLPDLTLSPFEINKQSSPFDLALILSEEPEGISACFEYKTDLFESSTIGCMIEALEMILRCVVTQPEIQLNQLVAKLNESNQEKELVREQAYKNTIRQKLGQIKQKSHRQ
ncbi:amino acid adenylation domain-containing protein [Nostoc sp. XA010]|uniref:non-ribosomal peptide synthetase n=1 Tax=Nostoc sp. XA010 TaxID=2780407 RepID=UPI001E583AB7|nr:non-ribosomal peptide synthetase [Nostoc sp. XA010]MCC5658371.1 amino acid adenylation domain-containing protein [Nostoc sp. XA010]